MIAPPRKQNPSNNECTQVPFSCEFHECLQPLIIQLVVEAKTFSSDDLGSSPSISQGTIYLKNKEGFTMNLKTSQQLFAHFKWKLEDGPTRAIPTHEEGEALKKQLGGAEHLPPTAKRHQICHIFLKARF
ncbi:hypothetical protein LR48_Vigan07g171000 [Vigna angularis]|uniref:Uncharacterized protein n=1 Tax=Phaseolus angularis TaxID=3914 RepID=A0A0L9UZ95_PHAAN|nr:hypothetical protein LR48_Vigan07g171000 [Vigna angularis]